MIKHYCDGCGKTLDDDLDLVTALAFEVEPSLLEAGNSGRWPKHTITVKTSRAVDGIWNDGDVCRDCLVRVITEGHQRRSGTVSRA